MSKLENINQSINETISQIESYKNRTSKYSDLDLTSILNYKSFEFSDEENQERIHGALNIVFYSMLHKIPTNLIKKFITPELTEFQNEVVKKALELELPLTSIQKIANPFLSVEEMDKKLIELLSSEYNKIISNINLSIDTKNALLNFAKKSQLSLPVFKESITQKTNNEDTFESIQNRIEKLGFKIEDFDIELLDGYKTLLAAKIDIPDNLLDPEISTGFFGMYCEFIADDETSELKATIPYLRSGMSFLHCKQISKAIKNNHGLLKAYDTIFSDKNMSKHKKYSLAVIAELGGVYEPLLSDSITDDQAKNIRCSLVAKSRPIRELRF